MLVDGIQDIRIGNWGVSVRTADYLCRSVYAHIWRVFFFSFITIVKFKIRHVRALDGTPALTTQHSSFAFQ